MPPARKHTPDAPEEAGTEPVEPVEETDHHGEPAAHLGVSEIAQHTSVIGGAEITGQQLNQGHFGAAPFPPPDLTPPVVDIE
jgi:hypothetical protein